MTIGRGPHQRPSITQLVNHSTLGQRIIIAFAVIMTSVTLFYSSALYYNFKWVELNAKEQAWTNGVAPQVNPGVYLFSSNPNAKPIPEKFSSASSRLL